MIIYILLGAVLVVLGGILIAIKKGFNQVILGLESLDARLSSVPDCGPQKSQ